MLLIRALALRDYYPFWKHRNERSRAGKLLLLDPDDHSTIQVRALSSSRNLVGVNWMSPGALDLSRAWLL